MEELIGELKEKAEEIVAKIKADPAMLAQFKTQPIKVIEKLIGIDLPDEKIKQIVSAVKAKLAADDAKETIEDAKEALGGVMNLFKKK